MFETVLQDLRYALRLLTQSPTFTAVAVGTLGLGIGAAVGIFTVVNAVLLRPLPIRDADRLGVISAQDLQGRGPIAASLTKFESLRAQTTAFEELAAYVDRDFTIDSGAGAVRVRGARVTAGFFGVLGVEPSLGRTFVAEDDVEGGAPVAVITNGLWRGRLGADPHVIGKSIRIEGRDTPVVGVLPAGFRFRFSEGEPQVYLTRVFTPDVMTAVQIRSGAGFLTYLARLKATATLDQGRADLETLDAHYRQEYGSFADANVFRLRVVPFNEDLVGTVRPALIVLTGAVLLLLMIACANVAHLLVARSSARSREVAVRLALGASHGRVVRQFLTETLLLAGGGCAVGIVLARVAVSTLVAYAPVNIPRLADATPDLRVLAFAIMIACMTAVVCGVIPALRIRSLRLGDSLKEGRPGGLTYRFSGQLQQWIAGSETAITAVLLITAALLFRSLIHLQAVDPGFDARDVTTAQISLQQNKYTETFQREAFFTQLLHDVRAQPGMAAVGATSYLPMSGSNYGFFFFIDGQPHLGVGRDPLIAVRHISADYFRVMQIPVRRGRTFTENDAAQSQPVAIINGTASQMFFPNVNPIGQHVANSRDGLMREIVGVVGDVRFGGPAQGVPPELYLPYRQAPWPSMTVVVSSTLPVDAVAGAIRRALEKIDRDQAVAEIRPMQRVVTSTTVQQRFTSSLLGTFALTAAALAAIGLYGVIAVFVTQRRHEFGIRMALGAQRRDLLRLVMRHGATVISAGTFIGLLGALTLSRLLSGLLYGVTATEPLPYLIGASILLTSGLLACYVPARRAMRVDPARILRAE